jgi:mannose-6-phosphate isomerase
LPQSFRINSSDRVGEIWFEDLSGRDLPLLMKYLFTSEKLSIQVHPNDAEAGQLGLPRGKNECWYILAAEVGATLGLGLNATATAEELRAAAIDGSIEQMMDWRPVVPGDFFYVPAGTIHAIGAGITLLEVQQNSDITYRLYDYGRPRELHLEEGLAIAKRASYSTCFARPAGGPVDSVLVGGPHFTLIRTSSAENVPVSMSNKRRWVIPLEGAATSNDQRAEAGNCLLLEAGAPLLLSTGSTILVAAEGSIGD